jgi:hypothetical protein
VLDFLGQSLACAEHLHYSGFVCFNFELRDVLMKTDKKVGSAVKLDAARFYRLRALRQSPFTVHDYEQPLLCLVNLLDEKELISAIHEVKMAEVGLVLCHEMQFLAC